MFDWYSTFSLMCMHFCFVIPYLGITLRNILFQRYCTSFYRTQMLLHFHTIIQYLYTAWMIYIRSVWCLPWRTHIMLAHFAGVMGQSYGLQKDP